MCTTGDTAHIDTIFKLLPHTRQHVFFFSFPVAVKNSIKVSPLVFLLEMFVITENIMKSPVLLSQSIHYITIKHKGWPEDY